MVTPVPSREEIQKTGAGTSRRLAAELIKAIRVEALASPSGLSFSSSPVIGGRANT